MARIGLFGGTFNPIHCGHLAVARQLRVAFPLDRIYLIPAHVPPHKHRHDLAPADQRVAMIRLALSEPDTRGLSLSEVELKRAGPSYTVDTVNAFRQNLDPVDDLFLILGADAFLELDAWRQWPDLLARVSLIVMSRPGSFGSGAGANDWKRLAAYAREHLDPDYRLLREPWRLSHPQRPSIYLETVPDWDLSSSQIRSRLRRRQPIQDLVPEPVAAYIASKGLYQ